ncbi:MAG: copper-binding protein [Lysobacter sp.]|nr:copper-binding protein [Lysobacter sp.]
MKREWILAAALAAGLAPVAATAADAPARSSAAAGLSAGEVRKVDREAKKVTIKHGPIENLKMPPMTMVFRVKEAAMLDGLQAGSPVRFRAEEAEGGYVVTILQKAGAK